MKQEEGRKSLSELFKRCMYVGGEDIYYEVQSEAQYTVARDSVRTFVKNYFHEDVVCLNVLKFH